MEDREGRTSTWNNAALGHWHHPQGGSLSFPEVGPSQREREAPTPNLREAVKNVSATDAAGGLFWGGARARVRSGGMDQRVMQCGSDCRSCYVLRDADADADADDAPCSALESQVSLGLDAGGGG